MRQGQALTLFFGLWLAISPWVIDYSSHAHAMTVAAIGAMAVLAGLASAVAWQSTNVPMWIAFALGAFTFLIPMIRNMSGPSAAANNDLIAGPLLALSASAALVGRQNRLLLAGPPDPDGAEGQASLS
jgi:hypothetical protein